MSRGGRGGGLGGRFPSPLASSFQQQAPVSRTQGKETPLPPVRLTLGPHPQGFSSSWGSRQGQLQVLRFLVFFGDPGVSSFLGHDGCPARGHGLPVPVAGPLLNTRDILQTAHPLAWVPLWLLSHSAYLVRTEGKNVFAWVLAVSTGRLLPTGEN